MSWLMLFIVWPEGKCVDWHCKCDHRGYHARPKLKIQTRESQSIIASGTHKGYRSNSRKPIVVIILPNVTHRSQFLSPEGSICLGARHASYFSRSAYLYFGISHLMTHLPLNLDFNSIWLHMKLTDKCARISIIQNTWIAIAFSLHSINTTRAQGIFSFSLNAVCIYGYLTLRKYTFKCKMPFLQY